MRVLFSAEALAELAAIAAYIARDNAGRARSFVQELRTAALRLATMPRGFPLVPRYAHLGVRRRAFGDYLIFYRADDEAIIIIHVLHGAMDHEAIMGKD